MSNYNHSNSKIQIVQENEINFIYLFVIKVSMKYSISDHSVVDKIPADTEAIHLTRPAKHSLLEKLFKKCNIREVTISKSCFKRLPEKTKKLFETSNANIIIEQKRGRAIDIPLEKMLEIIELRKDFQSIREIERLTGTPKSTIHYLIKYAERSKIKKGNQVVYLK
jgi:hypothetical protein